jgi:predicted short-subunit dehydrogenase-like oxidoreductase (DUF2520 family)
VGHRFIVNDAHGTLALIGPGRAGTTVATALAARGRRVIAVAGRRPDAPSTQAAARRLGAPAVTVAEAARDADLVVIATPDDAIEAVAASIAPVVRPDTLVVHLSGARGLDALAAVPARVGALHPLQTIPTVDAGLARLAGSWCAIAGDPEVATIAAQLDLRPVPVADDDRARYHAAACIASNHLVALLGQVERVSPVPVEALLPLIQATLDNVAELGPSGALTGPVARGDVDTVRAHLDALPADEHEAYRSLARAARRLTPNGEDDELDTVLR